MPRGIISADYSAALQEISITYADGRPTARLNRSAIPGNVLNGTLQDITNWLNANAAQLLWGGTPPFFICRVESKQPLVVRYAITDQPVTNDAAYFDVWQPT